MERIYISISEAAHMLGIGKTNLYKRIGSGELESVKLGKRNLVLVSSVTALCDRLAKKAK